MFRIYRYFAWASAIAVIGALLATALLYRQSAVRDMVDEAENSNIVLARALSNVVWERFGPYIERARDFNRIRLLAAPEVDRIDALMRGVTEGVSVLMIKIYTPNGLTVYSSDHNQIGDIKEDDSAYSSAALQGVAQSEYSTREHFSAFSGEVFNRDIIETYVPVRDDISGEVIGVFEIYSDVTELRVRIDHVTATLFVGLSLVFLVLYAILVLGIMRRAMAPLRAASEQASRIGPSSSGLRLPLAGMPKEALPLIEAVNGALDRLDRALDSQRQFTADAAHELLTPLTVLRAEFERRQDLSGSRDLVREVDDLSAIVVHLLELSEVDSLEAERDTRADLAETCAEVVGALAPVAYREGKEIAFSDDEGPIPVRCRPELLARALRNLIDNALAHAPKDTAVEVEARPDGTVRVSDRGPGIAPESRERVFQRFWRGPDKSGPGAGLGLSIVQRFVQACGGTIAIEDTPGGGATFVMRLPRAETTRGLAHSR